jgi:predicted permease
MLARLLAYFRNRLTGRNVEAELDDELRFHVEMEIAANRARGVPETEARRRALADLGSLPDAREGVRDARAIGLESIWRDVRYALRRLRAEPGFAAAAIFTLALGIGANTAVFGVVDAVLLRPLPYPHPERVVEIRKTGQGFVRFSRVLEVWPLELRESPAFDAIGLYVEGRVNLGGETSARVQAAVVTPAFFDVLAVPPALGRTFAEDDAAGEGRLVVLSDRLWRERLGDDPDVVGRSVTLDASSFTVIGVMPAGVSFPSGAMLWILTNAPTDAKGHVPVATVVGRLRAGIPPAGAKTLVMSAAGMDAARADTVAVEPLREALVGSIRPIAFLIWAASGLVLFVACINATNLLLARVSRRQREFAVRRALGATNGRLVQQTLVESTVLAAAGTLAALPAAVWTLHSARLLLPATWHGVAEIAVGGRTLVAVGVLALLAGVLFGLGPSLSLRSGRAVEALRLSAAAGDDRGWRRFRHVLLVAEVAIALFLMVGATALVTTVRDMMRIDMGATGERALAMELSLPRHAYQSAGRTAFFSRLDGALRALPGVEEVGIADQLPGRAPDLLVAHDIALEDRPGASGRPRIALLLSASPGYFSAAGIDVVAGRAFTAADGRSVTVVSEGFAQALGVAPARLIGERLASSTAGRDGVRETIVGVVRDVRMHGPENAFSVAIYRPLAAAPPTTVPAHLVVRAAGDPLALAPSIRAAVAAIDSDLPLYNVETFDDIRKRLLADRRMAMLTLLVFAGLALALSAIGIYGVTSCLVQFRTKEIGIRLAIGASRGAICRDVVARGATTALAGIVIGTAASIAMARVVASRVPALDGVGFGALAALGVGVFAVALLATMLPALRAMRIDPVVTLRAE